MLAGNGHRASFMYKSRESEKMLDFLKRPYRIRISAYSHHRLYLLAISAITVLLFLSACSKKSRSLIAPSSPLRIVFLPFNVPEDNKDLRWTAMAAPILMAKICERAPDLEAVPFWESMPVAIEAAGASRIFTEESVESATNWLAAKWSTTGEISSEKGKRVSLIIDFIPAQTNQVAFRYMKRGRLDAIGLRFPMAFTQFLRYQSARPMERTSKEDPSLPSLKELAEALNREYGWHVEAEPAKAQEIVENLARTDESLARLLFNPALYPILKNDE
jgi:hypothetical protein